MNKLFKLSCLIILSFFISCGSDDDGGPTGGGTTGQGLPDASAEYTIELMANFTEENNPQDYPENATFGTIVVITHSPEVSVYSLGQVASEGMRLYAESGDVNGLSSFISTSLGEQGDGLFSITTAGMVGAESSTSTSVTVTPARTRITVLARLNPSPDWFVGVNSFDVVNGDTLITSETIGLRAIDAGVILGNTYEANDGPENAAISVYQGAPFGDGNTFAEPIGTLVIERTN